MKILAPGLKPGYCVDTDTGEVTTPRVTVWGDGSKIAVTDNTPGKRAGGGKRGTVNPYFTDDAARRMRDTISRMEKPAAPPLFVTLTAPGKPHQWQNTTPADWHRYLDTFWKRITRMFPGAYAVWRLEPQRRGAPHFHLVVYGVMAGAGVTIANASGNTLRLRDFRRVVANAWYQIWGTGDTDHLKAGTQANVVNSWAQTCAYVNKYVSKVNNHQWLPQHAPNVGRLWGLLGRDNVQWSNANVWEVTYDNALKIIDFFRQKMGGLAKLGNKPLHGLSMRMLEKPGDVFLDLCVLGFV